MNIFMIYPCQGNMASFNYGLASVIASLKQASHDVKLVIVDNYTRPNDIIRAKISEIQQIFISETLITIL